MNAPAAAASTVVTIGFDDGTVDQLGALPILQAHGMTATFFVNSGSIGDPEHLSWADLHTLFGAGNEIAGHTLNHVNLAPLTTAEARQEVCTDRNNLLAAGFPATSFAYPFGSFDNNTEQVVRDCGYNSGRGSRASPRPAVRRDHPAVGSLRHAHAPHPKKSTKLSTLELYVRNAEANGGGWVQFVFHRLCEQCGPRDHPGEVHRVPGLPAGRGRRRPRDRADNRPGDRRPGATADGSVGSRTAERPARGEGTERLCSPPAGADQWPDAGSSDAADSPSLEPRAAGPAFVHSAGAARTSGSASFAQAAQ